MNLDIVFVLDYFVTYSLSTMPQLICATCVIFKSCFRLMLFFPSRRKPAVQARVSVDGTTRSGPPAQRSHNPVWFPARPAEGALSCVQHTSSIETKKECSVKSVRDAGQQQHISSRAGDGGGSSSVLDRTRGRNSYGGFEGGSSGGGVTGTGGGDTGSSRQVVSGGTVGRGLLFDVREFYGPCRIQVELVSGGGAGSSSGGLGTSGGGTVLGRCEARLAEALVGKGASTSLPSDGLSKGPAFSPESHGEKLTKCMYMKLNLLGCVNDAPLSPCPCVLSAL